MPVHEVTVDDLDQARAQGGYVLDVRQPEEYSAGHVPGARLLPLDVLPDRIADVPDDQPVWVVCGSGKRSLKAAELLSQAGRDARSVAGGTGAWVDSGRPVDTGAGSS